MDLQVKLIGSRWFVVKEAEANDERPFRLLISFDSETEANVWRDNYLKDNDKCK